MQDMVATVEVQMLITTHQVCKLDYRCHINDKLSAICPKGTKLHLFLFPALDEETLPKRLSLKERVYSWGSRIVIFLRVCPFEKESKLEIVDSFLCKYPH